MDLIDREAALGCFWSYGDMEGSGYDETDMPAYERLQALPIVAEVEDCISREDAKWVVFCNRDHIEDQANAIDSLPCVQPSSQPDKRLEKIADLVEGTIDHFDREDAMDLLYQIKEVLNER